MRTIYPAVSSEPELLAKTNVINLEEYRRQHTPEPPALTEDGTGTEELAPWARAFSKLSLEERWAWTLDACASLGVVLMTLAFVLRVLFL